MPIYQDQFKQFKFGSKIFIESGSHLGDGIQKALDAEFNIIYSYEINPEYYNKCIERFKGNEKVNLIFGDSVKLLPQLLSQINEKFLLWADSHFAYGFDCEFTPLMSELEIIKNHHIKNNVIMIDDIRLMAEYENQMPWTTQQVIDKLREINPNYKITFTNGFQENDILVAYIEE